MMRNKDRIPSTASTTGFVATLTVLWCGARLLALDDAVLPLTFVLPLLVCVWSRRVWQIWAMAAVFSLVTLVKVMWLVPAAEMDPVERLATLGATWFNIIAGGVMVQAIIRLRTGLEDSNAKISAQNAELEAQAEELLQQNEEIKTQAEELAQQNEEIETQSEELERQNEELHESNERLESREEILQGLLEASRLDGSRRAALEEVCRRALKVVGQPAEALAILERDGEAMRVRAQAATDEHRPALPETWPLAGSIAGVVAREDRTAYVSDLGKETTLAAPFGRDSAMCSVLATPLRIPDGPHGLLVACSAQAGHWTQEQFRVIEWVAAHCSLIVEARRWQDALAARARDVENASRAKDHVLAMLSHELRTPLAPVLAAAGALEHDDRLPADAREDLAMIRRNVGIQSRLIDDLLDVTRIGHGKFELTMEAHSVAELLREAAAIVAPEFAERRQTLELRTDGVETCVVDGDKARLQQVFWNLLKNAGKFSPDRETIAVHAEVLTEPRRFVRVEVRDRGAGIAAEDLGRIFLPFEQVESNGHRRGIGAGLGLGLAIAKAVVERHGGTITAASGGVGLGATFTVELPLADAVVTKEQQTRQPFAPAKARNILLVEDHADTGRIMARLLHKAGHAVEHVSTSREAMKRFGEGNFDLVISDLGLPDESGLVLMRKLREVRPELDGICLSGYGTEADLAACREAGFSEHLTKPVDLQRLHAALRRVGE